MSPNLTAIAESTLSKTANGKRNRENREQMATSMQARELEKRREREIIFAKHLKDPMFYDANQGKSMGVLPQTATNTSLAGANSASLSQ